ncbi:tRNA uridine-5-carboxymethylaminomethyl(34) synthesis GTPase MnmE [Mycoplasma procyoni]|uniref:tRNA uridine-5-carboxymethylaminomethyl(34) synthesis GTPase MnmE n=1 Tax=Mycoplasma procyoni TaxID=568784 RepID=UPI00197C51DE|nr:tRNA uridine-5-carboxymethylaminomethyl(34) synthesis GTPase MnmE [Mycoplasma procyoni]MBN3534386.1 tRNA uridine-5-carboxymethylaminomethyl(34) synthesis GTPase MnmE [Mycoplasma procyoni]
MFDNIAAISSGGQVNQAISIIRLTGPDVFEIVKKIFSGKVGQDKEITYGWIKNGDELIDEVLVLWFKGKNNFIGEDTVEINAHGGIVNTNLILELVLANGARLAEPGEFSRRAFLNGKMDLVKAEAINDLIHAKTKAQTQASIKKFDGKTSNYINQLIARMLQLIGTIEVNIDYPEYDDVDVFTTETLLPELKNLKQELQKTVELSERSRLIYDGVKIAIVGQPNAGKSSLLNALLNEEKAIVTDEEGTTRDVVEGSFLLQNIPFIVKDTAGIRNATNVVEKIGIERSLKQIKDSEIVVHLVDGTKSENDFDKQIQELSKNKKYIKVINKKDLLQNVENTGITCISAKNNDISELETKLIENYKNIDLNNEKVITNIRQLSLIKSSLLAIERTIEGLESGFEPDVVIVDLRKAWEDLVNITGKADNEELLDSMFKNFCLGK